LREGDRQRQRQRQRQRERERERRGEREGRGGSEGESEGNIGFLRKGKEKRKRRNVRVTRRRIPRLSILESSGNSRWHEYSDGDPRDPSIDRSIDRSRRSCEWSGDGEVRPDTPDEIARLKLANRRDAAER
jgi:hypothetical protein